jgi:hypothetical protein
MIFQYIARFFRGMIVLPLNIPKYRYNVPISFAFVEYNHLLHQSPRDTSDTLLTMFIFLVKECSCLYSIISDMTENIYKVTTRIAIPQFQ